MGPAWKESGAAWGVGDVYIRAPSPAGQAVVELSARVPRALPNPDHDYAQRVVAGVLDCPDRVALFRHLICHFMSCGAGA